MEKFIESFDDYLNKKQIDEASEVAERNRKLNDMIDKLKAAKDATLEWKDKYEKLLKDSRDNKDIEYALLKYKFHKGKSDMLEAEIKLMKMDKGKNPNLDKDEKEKIEKDKDKVEDKKD